MDYSTLAKSQLPVGDMQRWACLKLQGDLSHWTKQPHQQQLPDYCWLCDQPVKEDAAHLLSGCVPTSALLVNNLTNCFPAAKTGAASNDLVQYVLGMVPSWEEAVACVKLVADLVAPRQGPPANANPSLSACKISADNLMGHR